MLARPPSRQGVKGEPRALPRSLLPARRDFPVVRALRLRALTVQLPSVVCVGLRPRPRPLPQRL
ncbi:DUF1472 domain-containing protein (plasmid) [Kosakonia radicincitans]|nr:DUF1472 domain-containing protein [Kosakonia radicincitans]